MTTVDHQRTPSPLVVLVVTQTIGKLTNRQIKAGNINISLPLCALCTSHNQYNRIRRDTKRICKINKKRTPEELQFLWSFVLDYVIVKCIPLDTLNNSNIKSTFMLFSPVEQWKRGPDFTYEYSYILLSETCCCKAIPGYGWIMSVWLFFCLYYGHINKYWLENMRGYISWLVILSCDLSLWPWLPVSGQAVSFAVTLMSTDFNLAWI